jgi:hypothetical protein
MLCPVGFELELVHTSAERDCLNAMNAVRTAGVEEHMCMTALEKAVFVQVARDALNAHLRKCKNCRVAA